MATLKAGQSTTVTLDVGATLAIASGVGSGSVTRLANPQGGEPYSPVAYTGSAVTFGPYDRIALFRIVATAGLFDYAVVPFSGSEEEKAAIQSANALTLTEGRRAIANVARGQVLTVAAGSGAGSIVPLANSNGGEPGSPVAYSGSVLTFGPFTSLRRFRIGCTSGAMGLTVGYVAGASPAPTPSPTPAPSFSVAPSITPGSGTAGSTLFTANDGTASNTTAYARRWLLSGTAIGTGTTITPGSAGSLVLEVTATGPGGPTVANSLAVTVAAAPLAPFMFPTLSAPLLVLYGQGQMASTYSGPSEQLIRASDSTPLDLPNVNGALDVSAWANFATGTTTGLSIWYEQSGSGNGNATQTTAALRPTFRTDNAINGQYPWSNDAASAGLDLPAIVTDRANVTMIGVLAVAGGSKNDGTPGALASLGTAATATDNLTLGYRGSVGGSLEFYGSNTGSAAPMLPNVGSAQSIVLRTNQNVGGGANGGAISGEGTTKAVGNGFAGSLALTGGRIGKSAYSTHTRQVGQWLAFAAVLGIISTADINDVDAWASHRFGAIVSPAAPQLLDDGDSISAGTINPDSFNGNTLQIQTQELLPVRLKMATTAVAGQTAVDAFNHRTTTAAYYDAARVANFYHLLIGSNDIDLWANDENVIYNTYILPTIQAQKSAGFTNVVVGTIIARNWTTTGGGSPTQKEARRKALNLLIVNGAAANGYTVADYGGIAALLSNTTTGAVTAAYYSDGIHPNRAGYALMAAVKAAASVTAGHTGKYLLPLLFSRPWFVPGTANTGPIGGVVPGSTLSATGLPTGLTIDSANRRWVWDGTGAAAVGSFTLTETLSGAVNGPTRNTTVTYGIGATFDTFTETTAKLLTAHIGESRTTWILQPGVASNTSPETNAANRMWARTVPCNVQNTATVLPADQFAQAEIRYVGTATGQSGGVTVRAHGTNASFYHFRHTQGTGWQLFRSVGGTVASVATANVSAPSATPQTMRLEVTGTTNPVLVGKVDGVQVVTFTDTGANADLVGGGKAGVRFGAAGADASNGYQFKNFLSGPL